MFIWRAASFIFILSFLAPPALASGKLETPNSKLAQEYVAILQLAGTKQYDAVIERCRQMIRQRIILPRAYKKMIEVYRERRQLARADADLKQALAEDPENWPAHYARALVLAERKEYTRAIQSFKKCIEMNPAVWAAYSGLADAYKELKDIDEAIRYLQKRLEADEQNAAAQYGLGYAQELGYLWERSLASLDRSLAGDPHLLDAYVSKTNVYLNTARFQEMLTTAMAGLTAALETADAEAKSRFLGRIGLAYWYLGNDTKAIEYYREALETAREIMDRSGEGVQLNNLAIAYRGLSEHGKSLEYYEQALAIARALGSRREEAIRLGNIGNVYRDMKEYNQALAYYHQTLAIARALEDRRIEGYTLNNLGKTCLKLKDYARSAAYHQRARQVGEAVKIPEVLWQAYAGLAAVYETQGDLDRALDDYLLAVNTLETMRRNLSREDYKSGFLQNKIDTYERLIDVLIGLDKKYPDKGYNRKAFFYTESIKARALLDGIHDGLILRIVSQMPEAFQSEFSVNRHRLENAYARLAGIGNDERRHPLEAEIEALEKEKSELLDELKRKHPRLDELTSPKILNVEDVQKLLDKNHTLLEYAIGAERALVWVINHESVTYVELPLGRASLRRFLTEISATLFAFREERKKNPATPIKSDHVWADIQFHKLHQAYQKLVQPAEQYISPESKLLIVADDVLHYLPFEMLITRLEGERCEYLIEKCPVSYLASASMLNPELQRAPERAQSATRGSVLAFGNPYFGDRVNGDIVKGLAENLPASEGEAREITRLFDRSEAVTGREATEDRFKARAPFYQILHISTHSILDDRQWIYSRLVFARVPDAREDGDLHAYEIFNLRLDAELAVLSACQTGLGKFSRGEGLVGMSRAFLYAGVPSLVVSLWGVDDESTALLMKQFYKNLAQGLDKQQALQKAKLELMAQGNHMKNPFYWAPFILLGDWTAVNIQLQTPRDYRPIWICALVLLMFSGYLIRGVYTKTS